MAGYEQLREEQRQARERGEIMGIGVATTIEVSGQGSEYGSVEIEPDGSIVAKTGSSSHGQGHETSFAQVVADRLGVPFEKVRVVHGDTATMPRGGGTGGSRSMVVGGSALSKASDAVIEKALRGRRGDAGGLAGRPGLRARRRPGAGRARAAPGAGARSRRRRRRASACRRASAA